MEQFGRFVLDYGDNDGANWWELEGYTGLSNRMKGGSNLLNDGGEFCLPSNISGEHKHDKIERCAGMHSLEYRGVSILLGHILHARRLSSSSLL